MKYPANRKKQGLAAFIFSLVILAAAGITLEILFGITRYVPLSLCASFCIYSALVNAILSVAGITRASKKEVSAPTHDAQAEGTEQKQGLFRRLLKKTTTALRRAGSFTARTADRHRTRIAVVLLVLATAAYQLYFFIMLRRMTTLVTYGYYLPVVLLGLFLVFISAEKWCKHNENTDNTKSSTLLRNMRLALVLGRLAVLFTTITVTLSLLNLYDAQRWLVYLLALLWYYSSVFAVLSLVVRFIKKELLSNPKINVPLPFAGGSDHDLGVLSYLEDNTGITMRSLWSLRMARSILPYTIVIAAALLWISTGIVQVESYSEGAVYRFGRLQDDMLTPGLHLTLPWPIDKVVMYDTEIINKVTIGYRSATEGDNTWTGNHSSNEYKLLLGAGKELVSINLRLEYHISDLGEYLRTSAAPEKILEALAYELVTDRTINTDLESLLSVNRAEFASSFKSELEESLKSYHTGLAVVSVILESIHPPIEVAATYQRLVSAEVEAQKYILEAQAKATTALVDAESKYNTTISTANAAYFTKTAAAQSEVASFMASVAADNAASDAYRYYKYLSAMGRAYQSARLIIVGKDIDSSNIYLGNTIIIQ